MLPWLWLYLPEIEIEIANRSAATTNGKLQRAKLLHAKFCDGEENKRITYEILNTGLRYLVYKFIN